MVNLSRDMIGGLVRLRVLHAVKSAPVSGVQLSQDLAHAGHHVSPGTLYPLLHEMEKSGWLKSKSKTVKGKRRRYYRLTKKGQVQLTEALAALHHFLQDILAAPETAAEKAAPDGLSDVAPVDDGRVALALNEF
jgi:PadR family transcriptional regulator, regulatory protein PadR